jgi:hypothetical protein
VKTALDHVLWLGGAPDAGKTTVARLLAERHGFHLYVLDAAMQAHWAKATPARHPALTAFQALTLDVRWVLPTPAAMAQQIVRIGAERFDLAIEDLLMLPRQPRILAEGPWLCLTFDTAGKVCGVRCWPRWPGAVRMGSGESWVARCR